MTATALPNAPVLMADDDPDDRRLAVDAFRAAELDRPLHFVDDGESLLAYLRASMWEQRRPALVLLDLNMPRMDGREALQAIRADPDLDDIPVVVLTTSHAEEDAARARAAGCDDYLTKPASFVEMVELVRTLGRRWLDA